MSQHWWDWPAKPVLMHSEWTTLSFVCPSWLLGQAKWCWLWRMPVAVVSSITALCAAVCQTRVENHSAKLIYTTSQKKGRWTELSSVVSQQTFRQLELLLQPLTCYDWCYQNNHSNNWRTIAMWLFVDLTLFIISMPEDPRGVWHEGSSL